MFFFFTSCPWPFQNRSVTHFWVPTHQLKTTVIIKQTSSIIETYLVALYLSLYFLQISFQKFFFRHFSWLLSVLWFFGRSEIPYCDICSSPQDNVRSVTASCCVNGTHFDGPYWDVAPRTRLMGFFVVGRESSPFAAKDWFWHMH